MPTETKTTQTDIRYWYKHGIHRTNISPNSFIKLFSITIGSSVINSSVINSNFNTLLISKDKVYMNKLQFVLVIPEKGSAKDQTLVRNDTIKRVL